MYSHAFLCKNEKCLRPIVLPETAKPGTDGHQFWPADGASRNFLCIACNHLYEYSAQDIRLAWLTGAEKDANPATRSIVCFEVACGVRGCASRLSIYTVTGPDSDLTERGLEVLKAATAHDVRCFEGHVWNGSRLVGGPFKAYIERG